MSNNCRYPLHSMGVKAQMRSTPSFSNKVYGFTLIEILVAIAIIGILFAVAWPAYQNYTIQSRVSDLLSAAAPAQIAVTEFAQTQCNPTTPLGTCLSATNVNGTYTPLSPQGDIKAFSINPGGIISITGTEHVGNIVITLTPSLDTDGTIHWTCRSNPLEAKKYAPSNCQ